MTWWAKTSGDGDYLPVAAHLRDAGEVGLRLFDFAFTGAQRAWIASDLGVPVHHARALAGFLVAAHDIGKVGPFQHQVPELSRRLGSADLLGFVGETQGHDRVGGCALHRFVIERGGDRDLADALAAAVCGHHSIPAAISRSQRTVAKRNLSEWWPHQEVLLDELTAAFGPPSFSGVTAPSHGVTLLLAGLVNVSDWTASDAQRFPVTSGPRSASTDLADAAIVRRAWEPRPVEGAASFEQVFGFVPRSAQAALVDLLENATLPAFVLIEDRTGSGKTESALWTARQALERGARGLYVGLPTRATAGQFHARAAAFLDGLWPGERHGLRLLHGGAHLRDPGDPLPSHLSEASDGELAAARAWFDGARRGLLSPYAVGTIDQALLAVLSARFYPVRLWGLAGNVVIVDEAHAYDAYTGGLLTNLVRWLAALECTVVVLSATLPRRRRDELVAAYREGRGAARTPVASSDCAAGRVGYPRITLADRQDVRTVTVDDDRPGRSFIVEQQPIADEVDAIVDAVGAEVRDGGCVALVCSTVAEAQSRYEAVRRALPEIPTILLHSRIRPIERAPIEEELARRLGPQATGAARPERLVVVSTQIIEQSLDLDFDLMLSDLAPVDLLVQRAGRVHRHAGRKRAARHAVPRLLLLDAGGGDAAHRSLPAGSQSIYVDALLVRTRAALRGRTQIAEPEDLDGLIGEVYDEAPPPGLAEDELHALAALDREAAVLAAEFAAWARTNGIGVPHLAEPPWPDTRLLADGDTPGTVKHNTATTRWSERPSVDVVVLAADEAGLADKPLTPAVTRDLLLRAVGISDRRITAPVLADLDAHQPSKWRAHGALAHHALAITGDRSMLPLDWDPVNGVSVVP